MYIPTLNAKISGKFHEIFTKISVKDPDPDPRAGSGSGSEKTLQEGSGSGSKIIVSDPQHCFLQ